MSIHSSVPDPNRAKLVQLITKFLNIRSSGNFAGWRELLADDVFFTIIGDRSGCPLSGDFLGKKEFCDAFNELHVTFEIIGEFNIGAFVIEDDCVVVQLIYPWRSRGSGRVLDHESFSIFYFEDHLIKRYELFLDTAVLAEFSGEEWTVNRDRHLLFSHARPNRLSVAPETFRTDMIPLSPALLQRNRARQIEIVLRWAQVRRWPTPGDLEELATENVLFKIAGDWTLFRFCGTYVGRDAIRETFRFMEMAWEALEESAPRSFIVDGDHVVFRQSRRWRSRESGMIVQFESASHTVLQGDRVREHNVFLDTAALARSID